MEVTYECEITLDKAHGWARLTPVPPTETLEEARQEGSAYLKNWPKYLLRVIKKTTETVWVTPIKMRPFWLSWLHGLGKGTMELHSPWWVSGSTKEGTVICAAVMAENEVKAKQVIERAYDNSPGSLSWRFCDEKELNWTPFGERFEKAGWMQWETHRMKGENDG